MDISHPSTWEKFRASFSYTGSLSLAWAMRDLISKLNTKNLSYGSKVKSVCCFSKRPEVAS